MAILKVLVCLVLTTTATSATLACPCNVFPFGHEIYANCENQDLPAVPSCVGNDTTLLDFSGNIVHELNAGFAAHMPGLGQLSAARCHVASISSDAFSLKPHLWKVELYDNGIQKLPPGLFDTTPHLKYVDLSGNMLSSLPPGLFRKARNLRLLDLASNYLTTLPGDLLGGCGDQAILHVGTNHLTALPAPLIRSCVSMVDLDASSNQMSVLPADVVKAIGQLSHLNSLKLHSNPWHCDCALSPLAELLLTHNGLEQQLTCVSPPNLKFYHVVHKVRELGCAPSNVTAPPASTLQHGGRAPSRPGTGPATAAVLAAVVACSLAIAAIAAVFTVRRRRRKSGDRFALLAAENDAQALQESEHDGGLVTGQLRILPDTPVIATKIGWKATHNPEAAA